MGIPYRLLICLLVVILPVVCAAGEAGHAVRDLDALAEPRHDAKVVWKLPKDATFELIQRQNAWAEISLSGQQGWVLFFFLRPGEAAKQNIGKELGGVLGLAARRQSGQVTAVLGVRGITEEQLKGAKFNSEELRKLESLSVPAPTANTFAEEGGLASREVNYLPAPVTASPGNETTRSD